MWCAHRLTSGRLIDLVGDCSKEKKLLRTLKFPKEFELKVEFKKINWEVMKAWIAKRVTELLGLEDEVVIGYIYEQFESGEVRDLPMVKYNHVQAHF